MKNRQRIILLMAILTAVTFFVTAITMYFLYRAAINGQRDRLENIVDRQTSMIEAIVQEAMGSGKTNPDSLEQYTLRHLRNVKYTNLGRTGEFTLTRKEGDRIVFLLERRYKIQKNFQSIPFNSRFAEPSRRALSGQSGTVIGIDYRGEKVLAAYRPIPTLNAGGVAKIDFTEIRAPYIRAGLISGLAGALLIVAGLFLFFRVSNPILLVLEESEKKYRNLVESLQEGIWVIDLKANTTFVNPKMAEMLGYTVDEMLGKPLFAFMDEQGVTLAKSKLEKRKQGVSEQHDFEFIRKDGKRIYTALETSPVLDEKGRYAGAMAGVINITERKIMEEFLRLSEEKFRSIIEQSVDGIMLAGTNGRILEWNQGMERIMGLRKRDVLELFLWDVQFRTAPSAARTPEAYEQLNGMLTEFFQTHQAPWMNVIRESDIERPDGQRRIIQSLVFPIQMGQEWLACSIIRDVTEIKQAEVKLKSLLHEKEILLKEVYHRVKNNFQIVESLLRLQSRNVRNPKALAVFKESGSRIRTMSLIHEKLYRSDSLTGIAFGDTVRDLAIGLFNSYGADPSKIALRVDAANVQLGVDTAIPCGLIVNELVSNCLKYAFPKGWAKKGLIEIRLRRTKTGIVQLVVEDNGKGLPEELDVRMTQSLGLHLVTMLAENQLQGKLKLSRNQGTKFAIEFKD